MSKWMVIDYCCRLDPQNPIPGTHVPACLLVKMHYPLVIDEYRPGIQPGKIQPHANDLPRRFQGYLCPAPVGRNQNSILQ